MLNNQDYVAALKGKVSCEINVACSLLEHAVTHRVKGLKGKDLRAMMLTYANTYGVSKKDLDLILDQTGPLSKQCGAPVTPTTISAAELYEMEIEPPTWIIPGVLPAGLTILAGNPKAGKSWLSLDLAISAASGGALFGQLECEQPCDVLYAALEDTPFRLKDRMKRLLCGDKPPARLHISTAWPATDQGGLDHLAEWIEAQEHPGLVIIDTLQMIRPAGAKNGQIYAEDVKALKPIKALADKYKIAIVLVHHRRKAKGAIFETISGSYGLTGTTDTNIVLDRDTSTKNASLHITGRDVGETNFALLFDQDLGRWQLLGECELPATQMQQDILAAVKDAPMSPAAIAKAVGASAQVVKNTLPKMIDKLMVVKVGHGKYLSASTHLEKQL